MLEVPIPEGEAIPGSHATDWRSIKIVECSDPLVLIPNDPRNANDGVSAWPAYYKNPRLKRDESGYGELARMASGRLARSPLVFVRAEVKRRLGQAQNLLEINGFGHLQLVVVDGYRDLAVQKVLFDTYEQYLRETRPWLSSEELSLQAQRMVAMPPSADKLAVSPPNHLTGGAVDVVLVERSRIDVKVDGWVKDAVVDFGAEFDEMMHPQFGDSRSALRYFEIESGRENTVAQRNRRILYNAMTTSGFTSYPHEWWHFQYGNQLDSFYCGVDVAQFGNAQHLYGSALKKELSRCLPLYTELLQSSGMSEADAAILAAEDFGVEDAA